ncbi:MULTISPECIES: peptidylprolyl isomerase [Caulobacter]|jgi:peptidyl-prolyl cis-trans isomerase SurA|uniref:Parvulin-like PPIase n=1 Tax=Caulobacter rhizosphaerae TaxID=2010972 RepID=A0ABU1N5J4_9CAUL|nr:MULTISPECIES: peptidylprolyl isomerase [Caulobacter]KQZ33937.1 peptidylprolyl isomerase [Caulobacter sp. Root1472]MDR6533705.1 peptidyl-prolyl cis-trans isomerase SurA [Caulobacter rhizosphaerae]GGL13937.1 chaperone SurA [Caulobacter rhizosphaerae]
MRSARSVTKLAACTASILALTVASLGLPAVAQEAAPAAPPVVDAPAAPAAAARANPLSESVAAVVNDDIISSYDLMQRMRLLMVTSGLQPTQENLPQLEQEALRSLIDEHVQMQELRRVEKAQKITIISTDKEVEEQIEDIAKGNNMTAAQLTQQLQSQGVGIDTWKAQIRADSSWQAWISGRYGSRLRIGDDQIKAFERRQAEAASKPQYQVSEVFIDAGRVGGMDVALNGAKQLVTQMQQGAPFPAVARQFSASPTAANGGDAGWVSPGEMPPEVDAALEQLRPGQLSAPIPVRDGVYIVYLREKRSGAKTALVDLKQIAVALPKDAPQAQVDAAQKLLVDLKPKITSCETLEATAGKIEGVVAGDLGEAEITDLAPAFQEAANTLKVGQVSDPIRTDAGLHLIAVCGKRQSGAQAPTHDQIENRLRGQQLALISKRYLRDLRNSATIETR